RVGNVHRAAGALDRVEERGAQVEAAAQADVAHHLHRRAAEAGAGGEPARRDVGDGDAPRALALVVPGAHEQVAQRARRGAVDAQVEIAPGWAAAPLVVLVGQVE